MGCAPAGFIPWAGCIPLCAFIRMSAGDTTFLRQVTGSSWDGPEPSPYQSLFSCKTGIAGSLISGLKCYPSQRWALYACSKQQTCSQGSVINLFCKGEINFHSFLAELLHPVWGELTFIILQQIPWRTFRAGSRRVQLRAGSCRYHFHDNLPCSLRTNSSKKEQSPAVGKGRTV